MSQNIPTLLMNSLKLPYFETIEELSELTRLSTQLLYCLSTKTSKYYMIKKIPKLIKLAEEHQIDQYLTSSFLRLSPSHVYALICHLESNNIDLVVNNRLNPLFAHTPGRLKEKYQIDMKELMKKYPYEESKEMSIK